VGLRYQRPPSPTSAVSARFALPATLLRPRVQGMSKTDRPSVQASAAAVPIPPQLPWIQGDARLCCECQSGSRRICTGTRILIPAAAGDTMSVRGGQGPASFSSSSFLCRGIVHFQAASKLCDGSEQAGGDSGRGDSACSRGLHHEVCRQLFLQAIQFLLPSSCFSRLSSLCIAPHPVSPLLLCQCVSWVFSILVL